MNTVLPEEYQLAKPISREKAYQGLLPSPKSLVELASEVVDKLPLPDCWTWSVNDISRWLVKELNLPQYKECFVKNNVDGRKLVAIEASDLPYMNITNFEHIKQITAAIRQLFQIERQSFFRNICLPPRYPLTHYLLYKQKTGEEREKTVRTELFRKMKILDDKKRTPCENWDALNQTDQVKSTRTLIGRARHNDQYN